jgi:phosphoribosylaminoimidazole-succinocarboxamide synthase
MLVVATDRVSTYDVIHPTPIPGKGVVLTAMAEYWFTRSSISQVMPNHFITTDLTQCPEWVQQFQGRGMVVQRLEMVMLEAIVRGYITGSAWSQYLKDGTMNGVVMPRGMVEAQRLDRFTFTPSTKAVVGHDENISISEAVELIGAGVAAEIERQSLEIYGRAHDEALGKGIIIADTKLEFGVNPATGELVLGDEVLTPDSSRFWDRYEWEGNPGKTPTSLDKQFVRDYASSLGWDRKPPAPELSSQTVTVTQERYGYVAEKLTGSNPIAA